MSLDPVTPRLNSAVLGELWMAVTRAGGPVGFLRNAGEGEFISASRAALTAVTAGREHLIARWQGDRLIGVVFLVPGTTAHTRHRATVERLMVAPDAQGRGVGSWLLDIVTAVAQELRLELLLLSAREGHGLERFYEARGWTEVGRFPAGIRVNQTERRDEVWFARHLA